MEPQEYLACDKRRQICFMLMAVFTYCIIDGLTILLIYHNHYGLLLILMLFGTVFPLIIIGSLIAWYAKLQEESPDRFFLLILMLPILSMAYLSLSIGGEIVSSC